MLTIVVVEKVVEIMARRGRSKREVNGNLYESRRIRSICSNHNASTFSRKFNLACGLPFTEFNQMMLFLSWNEYTHKKKSQKSNSVYRV